MNIDSEIISCQTIAQGISVTGLFLVCVSIKSNNVSFRMNYSSHTFVMNGKEVAVPIMDSKFQLQKLQSQVCKFSLEIQTLSTKQQYLLFMRCQELGAHSATVKDHIPKKITNDQIILVTDLWGKTFIIN